MTSLGDPGTLALAYGLAGLALGAYLAYLHRQLRALEADLDDHRREDGSEETEK